MISVLHPPPAAVPQPASDPRAGLRDLLVDVAIPTALYFLGHDALGWSVFAALVVSSVLPLVRLGLGLLRRRRGVDQLALLMLVTNVAALAFSLGGGGARVLLAKDAGASTVIGLAILLSVLRRQPLMSKGLEPFLVKGDAGRLAALSRLRAGSAAFRRRELAYSLVWGVVLLADCAARIIGALTIDPATMAWLSTVILVAAIATATVVGGIVGAGPMMGALDREAGRH